MERRSRDTNKILELLSKAEKKWKDLPTVEDLRQSTNSTLERLEDLGNILSGNQNQVIGNLNTTLREFSSQLAVTKGDIQQHLVQSNTMIERFYNETECKCDNHHQEGNDTSKILELLSKAESKWKDLPTVEDLRQNTNITLEQLNDLKNNQTGNQDQVIRNVNTTLREFGSLLAVIKGDIQQKLIQSKTMMEQFYNETECNCDNHREKDENGKTMAINVCTKNDVQQVSDKISDLMSQYNLFNASIIDRINKTEATVIANQSLALNNVSARIEMQMSRMLQQIKLPYQQLDTARKALFKLTVGNITNRITKNEEKLNDLLGTLSYIIQDFKSIKSGISETLEETTANSTVFLKLEDWSGTAAD